MGHITIGGILNNTDVDVDGLVRDVAGELMADGHQLLGLIQSGGGNLPSRCAGMEVTFIGSDRAMGISQDLGPGSGGCCLDTSQLSVVAGILNETLDDENDVSELLILSRFGKSEAAGGGLIDCASHAIASGVPVLMAVSAKHLDAWRDYHGGLGEEIQPDKAAIASWCRGVIGAD